jgi:NitT/TauT family transport system permease protein
MTVGGGRSSKMAVWRDALTPWLTLMAVLLVWEFAVRSSRSPLLPTPTEVAAGLGELVTRGVLFKYVVASLFRTTYGFGLAVLVGIPLGLALGWWRPLATAWNPLIQILRPISPIAWIPLAILWFGVTDAAPIFLIFLASVFPITVSTMAAVHGIPRIYLRAAQNFDVSGWRLIRQVVLPACLPQIITSLRIALGVAWLVVVAAEMIAVDSGLGYLIIDARNAGKRYDLVVAGMVLIGAIGLGLDALVRRLERLPMVQWGLQNR